MAGWYVRDRGRVMGPLTSAQILDLRDRGQIQGYHEVSTDRRAWRAVDLVPELSAAAPPPPPPSRRPAGPPPAAANTHTYKLIVGGVVAVVVLGGLAVGAAVVWRNWRAGGADPGPDAPAAVGLAGKSARSQEELLRSSVCLVVTGMKVQHPDGAEQEALACLSEQYRGTTQYRFGNPYDFQIPGKKALEPGFRVEIEFGTGSGFAVTPSGYILTNKHVVKRAHNFGRSNNREDLQRMTRTKIESRVWVFFGRGQKYTATVEHVSGGFDMALLKIDRPDGPYLPLCSTAATDIPATLKNLSSVGFPGVGRFAITPKDHQEAVLRRGITAGPVERLLPDRAFEFSHEDGGVTTRAVQNQMDPDDEVSWILQHGAKVAAGNSGGPLITADGLVLGINSWRVPTDIEGNQYFALTLPQLRNEIDAKTNRGVTWRELPR